MTYTTLGALVVLFACICGAVYHWKRPASEGRYKKKPLLSIAEKSFFHTLEEALPEFYIFPQVSMGAIMGPRNSMGAWSPTTRKEAQANFWAIASKRIDYCVVSKDLELLLLIELDDSSHNSKKSQDRDRDARVKEAGFSTLRMGWKDGKLPGAANVRKAALELISATRR